MHGFATAGFFPGRFFHFLAFFDSLKPSRLAGLFSYRSVIPLLPTKLCCANFRGAPPCGLMREAGIHFITPTQDKLTNRREVMGNTAPLSPVPARRRGG